MIREELTGVVPMYVGTMKVVLELTENLAAAEFPNADTRWSILESLAAALKQFRPSPNDAGKISLCFFRLLEKTANRARCESEEPRSVPFLQSDKLSSLVADLREHFALVAMPTR